MHDLDIELVDGTVAAVEVTAAADPASIELWKLVNGRDERWIVPGLLGGWMVMLEPAARAKRLLAELPVLLKRLEERAVVEFGHDWRTPDDPLVQELHGLGALSGSRSATDHPGVIYLSIQQPHERTGGVVADTGDALAAWAGDFLQDPQQADVLAKLDRSGAAERHAFIILPGFTTAPFTVTDLLWREAGPLPSAPPVLPPEVTHIWLVASWNTGRGVRWSPDGGWRSFSKKSAV
ncbi:MAG: hypothetical protein LC789_17275 [Actinobacteria bacterium]|nr:hypothetical protein [Actinomycetota bacterium]